MLKVIHLIPFDGIGGVESAARSMLGNETKIIDFKLLLVAGKCLIRNSDHVVESPFLNHNNPIAHIYAIYRILKERPDILVCSLWRTIFIGLLIGVFLRKTRIVCFLHRTSPAHFLDSLLHKAMLFFCDAVWADSRKTLESRTTKSEKITRVISFVTVHPTAISIRNQFAPKFVFWGRIHKVKGLDRSISLINLLVKLGYQATYDIWGPDGGQRDYLNALIRENNLQDNVVFRGAVKQTDLFDISSQYAFYLQLSREEGMAMSVVEAMQYGLIPVVTPVGEIEQYCTNEINSVVVDDINHLQSVANIISQLLTNENKYRSIQKGAQNYWTNHILYSDDFVKSCIELYTSL